VHAGAALWRGQAGAQRSAACASVRVCAVRWARQACACLPLLPRLYSTVAKTCAMLR